MSLLTLSTMLAVLAPGEPPPAALVLNVRGSVTVRAGEGEPRPARAGDRLSPGDAIAAPADGEAALVLYGTGRRARLKPGATARLTGEAFDPAGSVEIGEPVAPIVRAHIAEAAPKLRRGRFAAGVLRAGPEGETIPVTPTRGALIFNDRPTLSWEPAADADSYRVRLRVAGDPKPLWSAEARGPRLEYPASAPSLERGRKHEWSVAARNKQGDERPIAEGSFSVAYAARVAAFAPVARLAASDDPADVLLAALTYEDYGAYDDALACFERLTRLSPSEPAHFDAVADYYEHAGRHEPAAKARDRAKSLRDAARPHEAR